MITIITGNRAAGKTTVLLNFIKEQKNKSKSVFGIMTPGIYDEDKNKIGFVALDICSGESWELGRSDKKLDGPGYGPFSFSGRGFIRANEILKKVFTKGTEDIFLDEIGPLELKKGYGFFPVLSLIRGLDINRNLYLVIRPELINEFIRRFISGYNYRITEITQENREVINLFKQ